MAAGDLVFTVVLNDRFTRGMLRVAGITARAGRRMVRSMGRVGASFVNLRNVMIAAGIGGIAVKMAVDFETSMQKIVGLVGVSQDQVDAWAEQLKRLAPEVAKSPNELARALFFVASAGFEGEKAMEILRASAEAASAGLGETEVVANALTGALTAYKKSGLDAATATGILVAAVREGKLEAAALAPVFGRVLSTASAMGVGFDEVSATLAALSRVNVSAEEGATALRAVLLSLAKPTTDANKALAEIGTTAAKLRDSLGKRGLLRTLIELRARFQGNEQAIIRVFGNVRAFNAVVSILGDNLEDNIRIFNSLARASGRDLVDAFTVASDTARFKLNAALAMIKVTMIDLGKAATPIVVKLAQLFSRLTKAVTAGGLLRFIERGVAVLVDSLDKLVKRTDLQELGRSIAAVMIRVAEGAALLGAALLDLPANARAAFLAIKRFVLETLLTIRTSLADTAIEFAKVAGAFGKQEAALAAAKGATRLIEGNQALVLSLVDVEVEIEKFQQRVSNVDATRSFIENTNALIKAIEDMERRAATAAQKPVVPTIAPPVVVPVVGPAGGLIASLQAAAKANRELAAAERARAESSDAILGPLIRQIIASRKFSQALGQAVVTAQNATPTFEEMGATIAALPSDLQASVIGANDMTDAVRRLAEAQAEVTARTKETKDAQTALEANARVVAGNIRTFFSAVADIVGRVLDAALEGQIRTMKDVAKIAQDILKSLIKQVVQALIELAAKAVIARVAAGVGGGATVAVPAGAKGGVVVASGVPGLQGGGVITREGIFRGGEAGPELVVPLQGGEVPVRVKGGGEMGRTTNVFLTIQAMDARDVTRVLTTPEGREAIKANIAEAMDTESEFGNKMRAGI